MRPRIPELRVDKAYFDGQLLDVVTVQPEGPPHFQRRAALEVLRRDPDRQFAGHDPAIQVAQAGSQDQPRQVALLHA